MQCSLHPYWRARCSHSCVKDTQMVTSSCRTTILNIRTSNYAKHFITANNINWWKTPPESPDLNPIENLWHELKGYLRREIKPTTKDALINGVKLFWKTVDVAKCTKYIGHLKKVIPRVIELEGKATGY